MDIGSAPRGTGSAQDPPVPPPSPEQLRAALQERIETLKKAALDWGIQPDYPEAAFISSMIATQSSFGDIAVGMWGGLLATQEKAQRIAETEVARLKLANDQAVLQLHQLDGLRAAQEVKVEEALTGMVKRMIPGVVKGVGDAVVIRERRYNRRVEWGRAALVSALVAGLWLGGYGWRAWQDRVSTSAIARCVAAQVPDNKTGKGYCPLEALLPDGR